VFVALLFPDSEGEWKGVSGKEWLRREPKGLSLCLAVPPGHPSYAPRMFLQQQLLRREGCRDPRAGLEGAVGRCPSLMFLAGLSRRGGRVPVGPAPGSPFAIPCPGQTAVSLFSQIAETYAFLPREAVTRFLMSCTECQKRMHFNSNGLEPKGEAKEFCQQS